MSIILYVPADSAALSLDADDVAAAIQAQAQQRGADVKQVSAWVRDPRLPD